MKYQIIHFYNRLSRIFAYLPILWNIYDFDHTSALEVFKLQLTRIYKSMENGHECRKSLKVKLRKIKVMIECCNRLNNDFEEQAWDEFTKKYPDRFLSFFDGLDKPKSPQYKKDLNNLIKYEKHRKAMYKQLFMKIFERNFESFWD